MENRIVVFKLPIDPVTKEISETELFNYRGVLLAWGVRTELVRDLGVTLTNTVAIVDPVDCNSEGLHPVMILAPEEISFE